jgi:hypothetical protein
LITRELTLTDALNLEISRNKKEILYQFDNKKNLFTAYIIVKERNDVSITDEISKSVMTKKFSGFLSLPGGKGYVARILSDSVDDVNSIKIVLSELSESLPSGPITVFGESTITASLNAVRFEY